MMRVLSAWAAEVLGSMILTLLLCGGCATSTLGVNPDPDIGSDDIDATIHDVPSRGGLALFYCRDGRSIIALTGELLAIDARAVWLLDRGRIARIERSCLGLATIERHRSFASHAAAWTVFGLVSTFAHGAIAGLTVPVWLTAGATFTAGESAGNDARVPIHKVDEMRWFARWPSGLPQRYTPATAAPPRVPIQYYAIGVP